MPGAPEIHGQTSPRALGQGSGIKGSWGGAQLVLPMYQEGARAKHGRPLLQGVLPVLNTRGTAAPPQPPKAVSLPAPPRTLDLGMRPGRACPPRPAPCSDRDTWLPFYCTEPNRTNAVNKDDFGYSGPAAASPRGHGRHRARLSPVYCPSCRAGGSDLAVRQLGGVCRASHGALPL